MIELDVRLTRDDKLIAFHDRDVGGKPVASLRRRELTAKGETSVPPLLEEVVELAGQRASPELLSALGQALLAQGRPAESLAVWERLLAREGLSLAARIQALRARGLAHASTGNHERAAISYEKAIGLARPGSPGLAAEVLVEDALVSWLSGGPARSLPLALRAKELAEGGATTLQARAAAAWVRKASSLGASSDFRSSSRRRFAASSCSFCAASWRRVLTPRT